MNPPEATCHVVDSLALTLSLVETIRLIHDAQGRGRGPFLFIDLEGISLSRNGSVSLVVIYVKPQNKVYFVDIHVLKEAAFMQRTPSGVSLKAIFEDPAILKVFFDVRNDSDALYNHYGIVLQGVEDVQLMENAARPAGGCCYLNGLARCLSQNASISWMRKRQCEQIKMQGLQLFHPSKGGMYEIFNKRPLDPVLVQYCANDVQYLPLLRETYLVNLSKKWRDRVTTETQARVLLAQDASYDPQAESKTLGPWPEEDKKEAIAREEKKECLEQDLDDYMLWREEEAKRLEQEAEDFRDMFDE